MTATARSLAEAFEKKAIATQAFIQRVERLNGQGRLSNRDTARIYGGVFIDFYNEVEFTIQDLCIGLVAGKVTSGRQDVRPLLTIVSGIPGSTSASIIQGGRRFISWLPLRETTRMMRRYLSEGKPLTFASTQDIEALEDIRLIRNALAHRSDYAMRKFKKRLIEGNSLPREQHSPSGYLRGSHAYPETRFDFYLAAGVDAITRICR